MDGSKYPYSTFLNLCNYSNHLIRQASDIRSLKKSYDLVAWDFNINEHPVFAKTQYL